MSEPRMNPRFVERARRTVRSMERELRATYGWTLLDVEVAARDFALIISGIVPVLRTAQRLTAALADDLPTGWSLDTTRLRPLRTDRWAELRLPITPVWQKLPSLARVLATELSRDDGPVELLAEHDAFRLIRAIDGTVGWIDGEVGAPRPAPRIAAAHGTAEGVVAAARRYLDAPYLLGGATEHGLDCSALVQRAFWLGLAVLLPRHSSDQLAATWRGDEQPAQSADLVFAWTKREGPCHVGVQVDGAPRTVIHASHGRKRVVEDPLDRFLGDASRVEIVPLPSVLGFHETNLGRSALELPDVAETMD